MYRIVFAEDAPKRFAEIAKEGSHGRLGKNIKFRSVDFSRVKIYWQIGSISLNNIGSFVAVDTSSTATFYPYQLLE